MKTYNERCLINGYEWGVEYKTNGEKPNLPDDVEVEWASHAQWVRVDKVCNLEWGKSDPYCVPITKFRIVDERYKPKEQEMNNNNWYEKGELPPVGEVCVLVSVGFKELNYEVEITYIGDGVGCYRWLKTNNEYTVNLCDARFRPLRTETDKLVEQMKSDLSGEWGVSLQRANAICSHLIKKGYRKIKQMSRDECISKIFGLTDNIGMVDAATLYDAGCRFIDQGE